MKKIMKSGWLTELYYVGDKIWSTSGVMISKDLDIIWEKSPTHRFMGSVYTEDKNLLIYQNYYSIGFIEEVMGIACLDLNTGKQRWDYTLPDNYKILGQAICTDYHHITIVDNILGIQDSFVYVSKSDEHWGYKINIDNGEFEYIENIDETNNLFRCISRRPKGRVGLKALKRYGYQIDTDERLNEFNITNENLEKKIKVKIEFDNVSIDDYIFKKEGYHFNKGGQVLVNDIYIYFFGKAAKKNKKSNTIMFRYSLVNNEIDQERECPFKEVPNRVLECFENGILLDMNEGFYYVEGITDLYKYVR